MFKNWAYQLQNVDPYDLSHYHTQFLVVEPARDEDGKDWSTAHISRMRVMTNAKSRPVVAYLSIGEAENYRPYWPGVKKAAFLDKENPAWPGNFKVKFWDPAWQNIIFSRVTQLAYLKYDGVYLDIIDAFEFYRDRGVKNADELMVYFVIDIAEKARKINKNFLVIPQNGEELLKYKEYRETISGIAREDLYFGSTMNGEPNDPAEPELACKYLKRLLKDGKPVFTVEYDLPEDIHELVLDMHRKNGFIPLIAKRNLDASYFVY